MTTKRYILVLLILALCTGAQAQDQDVYEAEREAQIQVSEAFVRLAETQTRYAEAWTALQRDNYTDVLTEEQVGRMRKMRVLVARRFAEDMLAEMERMSGKAESLRRSAADERMNIEESIKILRDRRPDWLGENERSLQDTERMAANFERAAALYRRAQIEYLALSTELEDIAP